MKKLLSFTLVLVMLLTLGMLTACQPAEKDGYTVGIIQLAEHPALDSATEGFKAALTEKLGDKVTFDEKNAQGEQTNCSTIVNGFVNGKVDLIMANATNAVKAAMEATSTIPVIGTSVTSYEGSGLVASDDAPGANVTGASDYNPVSTQISLVKAFVPDAQVIGIVYASGEENSLIQANEAKAAFEDEGYTVKLYTVADTNEIASVVTQACTEVDAFYEPTDNVIASNVSAMTNITTANKIPVFCCEEGMVGSGMLAAYALSYYDLGYQAGLMAYDVLANGKNPAEMPIFKFDTTNLKLAVNETAMTELGLTMPDSLKK
ncbi:MAG: ABC transporter substrate-binding protein [Clostridia bacterium]|nr:ABC transporter substrate-binding protein [Clostridia bacterium]